MKTTRKATTALPQRISGQQIVLIEKRLQERAESLQSMKSQANRNATAETEIAQADEADVASAQENAESSRVMAETLRLELMQVQSALNRIRAKSFGVCEECETQIPVRRLEIRPEARLCIDCQSEEERHFGRPSISRGDIAYAS